MKNTIKKVLLICLFFVSLLNAGDGLIKGTSFFICNITHPVEYFDPTTKKEQRLCEEQHVIPDSHGGSNYKNITIIPRSSHSATDRWNEKVWLKDKSYRGDWETAILGYLGLENFYSNIYKEGYGWSENSEKTLTQAYRLGRWQLEPMFFLYNFKSKKWDSTLFEWDGMSHLVYIVTWWVNTPAKYVRKTAYLIDKGYYRLLIDQVIQIPVLFIEGIFSTIYHAIGIITGTLLNPYDTFVGSLIPGIILIIKGIIYAVIDLFLSLFDLILSIF